MDAEITNVRTDDIAQIRHDIEMIKNILLSEGELTDWAKRELTAARKVPESECVSHEDVEDMILRK